MTFRAQLLLGVALIALGGGLAIGFPEAEFIWFRGRPLGVVLAILGLVEIGEAAVRRRRRQDHDGVAPREA